MHPLAPAYSSFLVRVPQQTRGSRLTIEEEREGPATAKIDDLAAWVEEAGCWDLSWCVNLVDLAALETLSVFLQGGNRKDLLRSVARPANS